MIEAPSELMDRGLRGGPDFADFYASESLRLVRALHLLTGSVAEAEDLAQEAMVRAYERWARVRTMDSPIGYVYRVAFHLNRRRLRTLMLRANKCFPVPAESPDPSETAEARSDVLRTLMGLRRGYREVLVLREWLGMEAGEAARVLGIEAVSVRARLHRARVAFRNQIGEGYE